MRLVRYLGFVFAGILLLAVGAHLRIAKITIKEPTGARTVFRICLPGRNPNVFAMTDRDFMCHLYDCYGLRRVGGFGLATSTNVEGVVLLGPSREAGTVTKADAVTIARRAVATNEATYPEWLATNVIYRTHPDGRGWSVVAEMIVGTNNAGEPLFPVGSQRFIGIDERGAVTHYTRGL